MKFRSRHLSLQDYSTFFTAVECEALFGYLDLTPPPDEVEAQLENGVLDILTPSPEELEKLNAMRAQMEQVRGGGRHTHLEISSNKTLFLHCRHKIKFLCQVEVNFAFCAARLRKLSDLRTSMSQVLHHFENASPFKYGVCLGVFRRSKS